MEKREGKREVEGGKGGGSRAFHLILRKRERGRKKKEMKKKGGATLLSNITLGREGKRKKVFAACTTKFRS